MSANDVENLTHYLFMQLCIRGVCHVLFLNGRVYKNCVMMPVIIILVVHADAFLKNELYAFLAYPVRKCTGSVDAHGDEGENSRML